MNRPIMTGKIANEFSKTSAMSLLRPMKPQRLNGGGQSRAVCICVNTIVACCQK